MDRYHFEQLVREAILAIPQSLREKMDNVVIVIEEKSRPKKGRQAEIKKNHVLLGLYEGVPKTERSRGYFGALPDKITIFQESLQNLASSEQELKKLVRQVVWHEIAHHFGFDEIGIQELEAKKKKKL